MIGARDEISILIFLDQELKALKNCRPKEFRTFYPKSETTALFGNYFDIVM